MCADGPESCPGGGHFDHHEPILGLGSDYPLDDPAVHDSDWLLHFSAQDLMPCALLELGPRTAALQRGADRS